jgi:hypothetical protein
MCSEFNRLTPPQQNAVRSVIASSQSDFRTFEESAGRACRAYAYRNSLDQTKWGVTDADGDHIARGELQSGEAL